MELQIRDVSKTYANGVQALKDVTLTIPTGMYGLLGPNGAGKSTLMRILATLQEADEGSVRLGDLDVLRQKDEVRRILGYLPQEFGVYPKVSAEALLDHFALLEGIAERRSRREVVEALLRQVNLWDVRKQKLGGYSGGMKQRFGVAVALLGDPKLMIVDEPTAGLDPAERVRFLNLLSELGERSVVLLSTHIVEDVSELCTRMAIIDQGEILLEAEPLAAVDDLRGRMWRRIVAKAELAALQREHAVVSTKLLAGRTVVRVHADARPGPGFEPAEPDLQDVYFTAMAGRTGRRPDSLGAAGAGGRRMTRPVDVLVVGAGLAGLECARRLGAAGARVLLVDRKPAVDHAVHTTGIFVRRTLESFALPEDCLGPPVRRVALYSPAGRALALESPHDEFRVGRMGAFYRRALQACLAVGVQWAPDTGLAALEPDGSGSVATLERRGRREPVRARFVVGADGAMSRVAPALGLDENREWIVGAEEVFRGAETGHPPAFHCWLDPVLSPGYIAWVVDDGEEVHVGVGGYASRFRPAEALRVFRARVAARFGLEGAVPCERRGGRIPVGGVLPRIACARGLLTGDAAGAVSPLTAGGLDPCIRLSALAASVTERYLATGDPSELDPYGGAAFRARFRKRLLLRRLLSAVRSRAAAEAACAVLRLPPFRFVAGRVFFGRGSFPDPVGGLGADPVGGTVADPVAGTMADRAAGPLADPGLGPVPAGDRRPAAAS